MRAFISRGDWVMAVLILTSLAPATLRADDATAADAAKQKDVRKLLDLSGSGKLGTQVATQMISQFRKSMPQVPNDFWDSFLKEIRPEDMVDMVVPIYAKHFSDEEIKELIRFYESPIGKKLVAEQPGIMQESMAVGQAWGQKLAARVIKQLKEKGYVQGA